MASTTPLCDCGQPATHCVTIHTLSGSTQDLSVKPMAQRMRLCAECYDLFLVVEAEDWHQRTVPSRWQMRCKRWDYGE